MRIKLAYDDVCQLPHSLTKQIPEEYLDAMGHMNVRWYTDLFSEGMCHTLEQVGLSWDEIAKVNGGTFVLECHICYLSEVRLGETIDTYARIISRNDKRWHVMQFMTNRDKQNVAATYEMVGGYVDLSKRQMAPMPEQVQQGFDRLLEQHRSLAWNAPVTGVMGP